MSQHIESVSVYLGVFAVLMVLLGITIALAFVDLGGGGNLLLALTVAITKAVIIAVFFMHLRHSESLVWVFAAAGFIWLVILLVHTASDYVTRGWAPRP